MEEKIHSSELIAWKKSECVSCEFNNACPNKLNNLRTCVTEDGMYNSTSLAALLTRTIRHICKKRAGEETSSLMARKPSRESYWKSIRAEPRCYNAVLLCSSLEEYKRVIASDNNR